MMRPGRRKTSCWGPPPFVSFQGQTPSTSGGAAPPHPSAIPGNNPLGGTTRSCDEEAKIHHGICPTPSKRDQLLGNTRTKQDQKNLWVGYDATWRMGSGWKSWFSWPWWSLLWDPPKGLGCGTPSIHGRNLWLINGGDPNYLVTGMILQVLPQPK